VGFSERAVAVGRLFVRVLDGSTVLTTRGSSSIKWTVV
jgi:hypothetical protein